MPLHISVSTLFLSYDHLQVKQIEITKDAEVVI